MSHAHPERTLPFDVTLLIIEWYRRDLPALRNLAMLSSQWYKCVQLHAKQFCTKELKRTRHGKQSWLFALKVAYYGVKPELWTHKTMGHTTNVAHLLVMGNNTLVSISKWGECVVWNCETGKPLSKLMCPGCHSRHEIRPSAIRCACVLKDKKTLICGGDRYLILGYFKREKQLVLRKIKRVHPARVNCLCVLDDQRVAMGASTEICVFRLGTCLQTIKLHACEGTAHVFACTHLAALRDNRLVSGHTNNALRVWDTITGCLLKNIRPDVYLPTTLLLAIGDGAAFVSAAQKNYGVLDAWSAETYEALPSFFDDNMNRNPIPGLDTDIVSAMAFGENRIATIKGDGTVLLWVYGKGRFHGIWKESQIIRLICHKKSASCILPLQDGRFATGGVDDTLVIWGNGTKYSSNKLKHNNNLVCMAELPCGRIVCAYNRENFRGLRVIT